MTAVGQVLALVLWIYWLILLVRLILDFVQVFSRTWHPTGFLLIVAEVVYTLTDPPIRLVRRFVPPLRLGSVQLDLAFLIVLVAVQILINLTYLIHD
jgi:YggT family protein